MANAVKSLFSSLITATITLTSLANGAGRICTQIDNTTTRATRILVALKFKMGAVAPTALSVVKVYLIRFSGDTGQGITGGEQNTATATPTTDSAIASAQEPINSPPILSIAVAATANGVFGDLSEVILEPGAKYAFMVFNGTGQALSATGSDHILEITPIMDEIQ